MLGSVRGVVSNDHSYRDKANPRVPTLFRARKATRFGRTIARSERPGVVEEPGMCRSSLDGNREIPRLASCGAPLWPASGRRGAVADDERTWEVRLRNSSWEADEQSRATGCGVGGAKCGGRGECEPARAALRSCKALELPHHPVPKRKIDVSEQGIQGRWCVSSVVFNPTPQEGIDPPGDIGQRQLCLMSDAQVPDRRAHGFQRRGTDRWVEATEQCVVPGPLDPSWSKAISEKVELDVRIRSSATPVLAVDDLGLCRMQFQAALCQARLKFELEGLGFLLARCRSAFV